MAVRESGGTMINVSDDQILGAMRYTGRLTGIFAEPAAACAIAGLRRAVRDGIIGKSSEAVALVTGNGLKDVQSGRMAVGSPIDVAPDGNGLDEILAEQGVAA